MDCFFSQNMLDNVASFLSTAEHNNIEEKAEFAEIDGKTAEDLRKEGAKFLKKIPYRGSNLWETFARASHTQNQQKTPKSTWKTHFEVSSPKNTVL